MKPIVAFDSHKHYTQARIENRDGSGVRERRIEHQRGRIRTFLATLPPGCRVAVETLGNWYWIVDEIEAAGMTPDLVHARKAKLMLGAVNKTDKLDAKGLNMLQRVGTLPTVWIPPGSVRDHRELPRTRMVFGAQRTQLKNRIHSVIDKYGLQDAFGGVSDIFGKKARGHLRQVFTLLPSQTRYTATLLLAQLESCEAMIRGIERRMKALFEADETVRRLMTLPGVGFILAVVIAQEIGDIARFARAERLASYSGLTPRVHSSGGKTRYGRLRSDVNHYLKWAFSEAGNSVAVNHKRWPRRHVSQLYRRLRQRKGHPKAIGAVGRHLSEAAYWVLRTKQSYRDRGYASDGWVHGGISAVLS